MSKVIELYVVRASDVFTAEGLAALTDQDRWTFGDCNYSLVSREQIRAWLDGDTSTLTSFGKDVLYHYAYTYTYIALDK